MLPLLRHVRVPTPPGLPLAVASVRSPEASGSGHFERRIWQAKRASHPANGLLRPTVNWASALPNDARPSALLTKFPRIANLLAVLWQDPNSLRRYMDDLLVDKRGNRQGFPLDVLRELFALRAHFDQVHPETTRPWEVMNNGE